MHHTRHTQHARHTQNTQAISHMLVLLHITIWRQTQQIYDKVAKHQKIADEIIEAKIHTSDCSLTDEDDISTSVYTELILREGHTGTPSTSSCLFLVQWFRYEEISWVTKFFAAAWQNWDLRSSKKCPRQSLFKQFLTYLKYIGFVAPGFEGSKFLRKCWGP